VKGQVPLLHLEECRDRGEVIDFKPERVRSTTDGLLAKAQQMQICILISDKDVAKRRMLIHFILLDLLDVLSIDISFEYIQLFEEWTLRDDPTLLAFMHADRNCRYDLHELMRKEPHKYPSYGVAFAHQKDLLDTKYFVKAMIHHRTEGNSALPLDTNAYRDVTDGAQITDASGRQIADHNTVVPWTERGGGGSRGGRNQIAKRVAPDQLSPEERAKRLKQSAESKAQQLAKNKLAKAQQLAAQKVKVEAAPPKGLGKGGKPTKPPLIPKAEKVKLFKACSKGKVKYCNFFNASTGCHRDPCEWPHKCGICQGAHAMINCEKYATYS
jgi:hypothetical protein